MKTSRQKRLPIEEYALLTESAPELGAKLDHWYSFYVPATPGECELLDMAVMASVQLRRVHACLTETVNQQIRTANFDYDCDQEDEVDRYRAMLDTQPDTALHAQSDDTPAAVAPESMTVEQGAARRKQAAAALAPGGENGIGMATEWGDTARAAVMATEPLSSEELKARRAAEQEAARTSAV